MIQISSIHLVELTSPRDQALYVAIRKHECGDDGCEHASDCAVHNAPAMPNGPCDCGAA